MNNEFDLVEPVDPSKSSILNPRIPNDINRKATKKNDLFSKDHRGGKSPELLSYQAPS
jgi:hypothetical protein